MSSKPYCSWIELVFWKKVASELNASVNESRGKVGASHVRLEAKLEEGSFSEPKMKIEKGDVLRAQLNEIPPRYCKARRSIDTFQTWKKT